MKTFDKGVWKIVCFSVVVIVLIGGWILSNSRLGQDKTIDVVASKLTDESFLSIDVEELTYDDDKSLNELIEGDKKEIDMDKINKQLNEYLNECDGDIGLVFYDINSGETIKFNENEEFVGASTYKIFMNIAAYETLKSGYGSLDDVIYYSDAYYEGGTGILQGEYFNSLDLQTLLDYSIIYSDNIATNMITAYLGGMYSVLYTSGEILDENICVSENIITPNQMFVAIKFIYEHKDEEYYSHMIESMRGTIFHERIDKDLPQDIVAHKIGTNGYYIHDVGIVFLKDNPYIIVVYTCGVYDADKVISDISNIIYNEYCQE